MIAQPNDFSIRNAKADEMMVFVHFATTEGWTQSTYDAEYYYNADPNGFFFGELNGQIIAVISAVRYQSQIGYISFFIVKSQYRKNGFGKRMFTHALNYLEGCNIGLDAAVNLVQFYKSMGFKQYCKTYMFKGTTIDNAPVDQKIVKLSQVPFEKILQYQQKVSPYSRQAFLKEYIQMPESEGVAYYDGDILQGYGMLKKCSTKYRINPLYADNQEIAVKLINTLRSRPLNITKIIICVQSLNQKASQVCKQLDMKLFIQLQRMYTKELPNVSYNKIFGILSTDIG